jgi:aminodeoxyfutalosine deaminase
MDDFLSLEMPKAELHLHLEGSVEPETLHELDPATPVEELARSTITPISTLSEGFGRSASACGRPEDYALVTRRLLERLEAQNVRYAEIIWRRAWCCGRSRSSRRFSSACRRGRGGGVSPVEVRWILDAVRQFGVEPAMQVAELAAERVDRGVVAFGIGGSEERGRPSGSGGVSRSPGAPGCT